MSNTQPKNKLFEWRRLFLLDCRNELASRNSSKPIKFEQVFSGKAINIGNIFYESAINKRNNIFLTKRINIERTFGCIVFERAFKYKVAASPLYTIYDIRTGTLKFELRILLL
ncbi:hypothetical protein D3C85_1531920 [compost metagenome]